MARKHKRNYPTHPLHPGTWSQWLVIAVTWTLGQLPWRLALKLGWGLGRISYYVAGTRRRVARRNLELCFPELDAAQQRQLLKENLAFTGKGVAELALAWFGGAAVDRIPVTVRGIEHLQAAQAAGPVIVLSGHFTSLEMAARLLRHHVQLVAIYKPTKRKPVLNRVMQRARERNTVAGVLARDDARGIVRTLKAGMPVWYAGDQDYGRKHSVFAPFFGIPAATITALPRLTRMSNAQVVPLFFNSTPDQNGYEITIGPALENYPSGDDIADATRMNQIIEAAVQQHPAQYLWIHRRFKRQEDEAVDLYLNYE